MEIFIHFAKSHLKNEDGVVGNKCRILADEMVTRLVTSVFENLVLYLCCHWIRTIKTNLSFLFIFLIKTGCENGTLNMKFWTKCNRQGQWAIWYRDIFYWFWWQVMSEIRQNIDLSTVVPLSANITLRWAKVLLTCLVALLWLFNDFAWF